MAPSPSPRPPPPPWIGLGPPAAGALLLGLRGELASSWPLLATAALVVAACEGAAALIKARAGQPPVSDAGVGLARLVSVAAASLVAMVAVATGLGEQQSVPLMVVAGLLMLVVALATGVRRLSRARQGAGPSSQT